MTHHSKTQHKQRAIPPIIINWLRHFGYRITGMNGTTVIYFDKQSRRALCEAVGHIVVRRLDDMMDANCRSEEHTSELQSPYVISYAVFCLKKKKQYNYNLLSQL